ncbi:MAG: hypothetical protein AB2A00_10120 [Myxococcota bacterium]
MTSSAAQVVELVRVRPSGWRVGMQLIPVEGGVLIHSPTWLGEDTFPRVAAVGQPVAMLAPNHFHHLSLPRFRERWPGIPVVAAAEALPRLRRKGHPVQPVESLGTSLGSHVAFHPCAGVRTGETWVSHRSASGTTLVVCDAFFNVPGPLTGVEGWLLRVTRTGPGLRLGRTFQWAALRDPHVYAQWVRATLEVVQPDCVHFSHGEPIRGPDCTARLLAALASALER